MAVCRSPEKPVLLGHNGPGTVPTAARHAIAVTSHEFDCVLNFPPRVHGQLAFKGKARRTMSRLS
jgi:hypothetical protein